MKKAGLIGSGFTNIDKKRKLPGSTLGALETLVAVHIELQAVDYLWRKWGSTSPARRNLAGEPMKHTGGLPGGETETDAVGTKFVGEKATGTMALG